MTVRRVLGLVSAGAIVLTGCMGSSPEAINQQQFDAVSTVTKTMYQILGVDEPETLAISAPCTDSFGNETDETYSRYGSEDVELGRSAEQSLIDDVLAGFGEPPKRLDREGQLNTGEAARIVDFSVTIDDVDVYLAVSVTDSGRLGWSAKTLC